MPSSERTDYQTAVHDWNEEQPGTKEKRAPDLFDDTLRDGLQNPSVDDPGLASKTEMLALMADIGVGFAGIGMPSVSPRHFSECVELCRVASDSKSTLVPVCAARTLEHDVDLCLRLCDTVGQRIEIHVFLGTSSIRGLAENWSLDLLRNRTLAAVRRAVRGGVDVAFVAEDATRSQPQIIDELFRCAIGEGAKRLCLCDTVGAATPVGTRRIVKHALQLIASTGAKVGLDWHGHNDRGLALANALEAWRAGADRLHGTALGIGERVGNAPLELLVLNLHLAGIVTLAEPSSIVRYGERAETLLGRSIPSNYPLLGSDAFRTATGIHAAAICKAEQMGDAWIAERVYSSMAASDFGKTQEICVGQASGNSNVVHWLQRNGFPTDQERVRRILQTAKSGRGLLSDSELRSLACEQPIED